MRVDAVASKIAGRIVIRGNVYDDDGTFVLSFGPDGLDYMDWYSQIDDDTQLDIANNQLCQRIVPWLLTQAGVQI